MFAIWIANVVLILAISFQLSKQECSSSLRQFYWPGWVVKIAAGILLGLLYIYYYDVGDTFAYFRDANLIADLARKDPGGYLRFLWYTDIERSLWDELSFQQPRAIFLTKLASVFSLVTKGNYWLIATWFSLFSFISSWRLTCELAALDRRLSSPAIFALLFFPSVVFWSSGFIKESIAMAMLFFLVVAFLKAWQGRKLPYSMYVALPFALWILWSLKYYYLAVLFPVLVTELVYKHVLERRIGRLSSFASSGMWLLLFTMPLIVASTLHPNFYPERFIEVIVMNHDAFAELSDADDLIHYRSLTPDASSVVRNAPAAFFSATFRPFLWEAGNAAQIIAGIENFIVMVLLVAAVVTFFRRRSTPPSRGRELILIYWILLAVFLALSTPNFGTLSRYRIGFLPFVVILFCYNNILFDNVVSWLARLKSRLVQ